MNVYYEEKWMRVQHARVLRAGRRVSRGRGRCNVLEWEGREVGGGGWCSAAAVRRPMWTCRQDRCDNNFVDTESQMYHSCVTRMAALPLGAE